MRYVIPTLGVFATSGCWHWQRFQVPSGTQEMISCAKGLKSSGRKCGRQETEYYIEKSGVFALGQSWIFLSGSPVPTLLGAGAQLGEVAPIELTSHKAMDPESLGCTGFEEDYVGILEKGGCCCEWGLACGLPVRLPTDLSELGMTKRPVGIKNIQYSRPHGPGETHRSTAPTACTS